VWTRAAPVIRSTTVAKCGKNAVYFAPLSAGTVEDCTLSDTEYAAVYVGAGGYQRHQRPDLLTGQIRPREVSAGAARAVPPRQVPDGPGRKRRGPPPGPTRSG